MPTLTRFRTTWTSLGSPLEWLGAGVVPLSIVLMVLFVMFGSTGLIINAVGGDLGVPDAVMFPFALGGGLGAGIFATRGLTQLLKRYVPVYSSTRQSPRQ